MATKVTGLYEQYNGVSIHATLAGGDHFSRLSATELSCFYPRHPRGWRLAGLQMGCPDHRVSIHATLAGGDTSMYGMLKSEFMFLSTPPSRVATRRAGGRHGADAVSIHATLAGGDTTKGGVE